MDVLLRWRNLLSSLGVASIGQAASTALIALSGIALVRLLPTDDYAILSICTAGALTLNALADSGIALAVTNQAGRVLGDRVSLGSAMASGIRIRRGFLLATGGPISLVLGYLLWSHGTPLPSALFYTGLTLITSVAALNTSLGQVPLQLHQKLAAIQIVAVSAQAVRLVLYLGFLSVFPVVSAALVIGAATQIVIASITKRLSKPVADPRAKPDERVSDAITKHLWRSVPTAVFYSLTASLPIWLLSFLGTTTAIAQFGGLTRIISLQALFVTVFSLVLIPRFARLPDSPIQLTRFFLGAVGMAIACILGFTALLALSAEPILGFLGDEFIGLREELILYSAAGGVSVLYSLVYGLNSTRGWLPKPAVLMPVCLISQAAAAWIIAPRSSLDAILLAVVMPLPALIFLTIETFKSIRTCSHEYK